MKIKAIKAFGHYCCDPNEYGKLKACSCMDCQCGATEDVFGRFIKESDYCKLVMAGKGEG